MLLPRPHKSLLLVRRLLHLHRILSPPREPLAYRIKIKKSSVYVCITKWYMASSTYSRMHSVYSFPGKQKHREVQFGTGLPFDKSFAELTGHCIDCITFIHRLSIFRVCNNLLLSVAVVITLRLFSHGGPGTRVNASTSFAIFLQTNTCTVPARYIDIR